MTLTSCAPSCLTTEVQALPSIAGHMRMSERNLSRIFKQEVGVTLMSYVNDARIDAARRYLESTDRGLGDIARRCGFGIVAFLRYIREEILIVLATSSSEAAMIGSLVRISTLDGSSLSSSTAPIEYSRIARVRRWSAGERCHPARNARETASRGG